MIYILIIKHTLFYIIKKIRKTSLGLRFKKLGDHLSATIGTQKYIPHVTISTSAAQDLRLQNIQIQVHHLKDTIEIETTKILMLRAEVSKIKVIRVVI